MKIKKRCGLDSLPEIEKPHGGLSEPPYTGKGVATNDVSF